MVLLHTILAPWLWSDSLSIYWPIVVEGLLVSVALGLIGCFLVVRGMGLLGDALSHAVLPGIVIGFLIGGTLQSPWILVGATAVGMASAILIQAVRDYSRVKEDASLGIVFTAMFALGVVMINQYAGGAHLDLDCVLHGQIEYFVVQPEAIWPMAIILGGIVLLLVVFYRHLLVSLFDPGLALSLGIPAVAVHYLLMGVLSLTVVASFEAVGAILVVALLIMPGATARLWTDRMPLMLLMAAGHGVLATLLGYWMSHPAVMDTSASGSMTVAGFALFLGSWLAAPRHGVLLPAWQRRRLMRQMALENLIKRIDELGGHRPGAAVPLEQLAGRGGIDGGFSSSLLRRGIARGWLERTGEMIALTTAGHEQARRLIRAHELWEQYLQREIGLEADHVHDAAEWIEHHLHEEEVQRLDALLRRSAP